MLSACREYTFTFTEQQYSALSTDSSSRHALIIEHTDGRGALEHLLSLLVNINSTYSFIIISVHSIVTQPPHLHSAGGSTPFATHINDPMRKNNIGGLWKEEKTTNRRK